MEDLTRRSKRVRKRKLKKKIVVNNSNVSAGKVYVPPTTSAKDGVAGTQNDVNIEPTQDPPNQSATNSIHSVQSPVINSCANANSSSSSSSDANSGANAHSSSSSNSSAHVNAGPSSNIPINSPVKSGDTNNNGSNNTVQVEEKKACNNINNALNNNNNNKINNNNNNNNRRHVNTTAERVLETPDLMDDFYLNVLDWGYNNIICIGLKSNVYLWDSQNGNIDSLHDYGDNIYVSSVKWNHNAQYIAIGTSDGIITLYDYSKFKALRKLRGHSSRIGSLSWNNHILSSGSSDSTIRNNDVRIKNSFISSFESHEQEICGLKWNSTNNYLCSGSNDNKVCIWQLNSTQPIFEFTESLSAVKALAFCPWNTNILATGGGTGDRKIRIYNLLSGNLCTELDTQSQICSLTWNPFEKELLSSHGFSKNQLSLWKYPSLIKTHDLTGHTSRILQTSLSPYGEMVCTAAADETLRFWKVFENNKYDNNNNNAHNNRVWTPNDIWSKLK